MSIRVGIVGNGSCPESRAGERSPVTPSMGTVLEVNVIVVIAASLVLVGIAVGVSMYLRLGVEKSIIWASIRAAVQLTAVERHAPKGQHGVTCNVEGSARPTDGIHLPRGSGGGA